MSLNIFFDPVKESLLQGKFEPSSLIHYIKINKDAFPEWGSANLALIGLTEERGTLTNKGTEKAADALRKKLYSLKRGTGHLKIVDLGNLRNGENLEDTYLRIKEVCETLIQNNVVPMLIGGSHDLDYGQFMAYENYAKPITFLTVDAEIDMLEREDFGLNKSHSHKILVHKPNIIFHYSHLAYQTYLTDQETLSVFEKLFFEAYRVGQIHENLEEAEPVVRHADLMSFDMGAIKQTDAPGNSDAHPFGLTGEEACQLCWYAGLNPKMSSVGFYEFNPDEDKKEQTAGVLATMIWYFIEGYYLRKNDFNLADPQYVKYTVSMQEDPHKLVFYKNSQTEEWWMEVPYSSVRSNDAERSIVPCSYNDYKTASNGEIPNRWILTHAKLI